LNLVKKKASGMANAIAISSWYKSKDSTIIDSTRGSDGTTGGHVAAHNITWLASPRSHLQASTITSLLALTLESSRVI
jgi:hypothetical protein